MARTFWNPLALLNGKNVKHPATSNWDLFRMSRTQLVQMGTPEAMAELQRRARGPDGKKLAWSKPKAKKNPSWGW